MAREGAKLAKVLNPFASMARTITSFLPGLNHRATPRPATADELVGAFRLEESRGTAAHLRERLIAFVRYRRQIVFIKHVLTHREYDKGKWK
jgi:hypothetical protein